MVVVYVVIVFGFCVDVKAFDGSTKERNLLSNHTKHVSTTPTIRKFQPTLHTTPRSYRTHGFSTGNGGHNTTAPPTRKEYIHTFPHMGESHQTGEPRRTRRWKNYKPPAINISTPQQKSSLITLHPTYTHYRTSIIL
jgi:hypothetical protein